MLQNKSPSWAAQWCASAIAFYQNWLSPLSSPCCRFYPSCSEYARLSIEKNGCIRSVPWIVYRLLRCHPFSEGGLDWPPNGAKK